MNRVKWFWHQLYMVCSFFCEAAYNWLSSKTLSVIASLNLIINIFITETCINILHFFLFTTFLFIWIKVFVEQHLLSARRSILWSQLFIKNKHYIKEGEKQETRLKKFNNNHRIPSFQTSIRYFVKQVISYIGSQIFIAQIETRNIKYLTIFHRR